MRFVVLLLCFLAAMGMVDASGGFVVPEQHPKRHLLPNDTECGANINDRIFGGNNAELGEYPWLATFAYEKLATGTIEYNCGGSLINSQYVLTAAHCVLDIFPGFKLKFVRLGEYDLRTNPDCQQDTGGVVCAEPVQDFNVEKAIAHPHWSKPHLYRNDIALVRLDRPATFSQYVSPICMPFDGWRTRNYVGSEFWIAGFGRTETGRASDILQELKVPVVLNEKCLKIPPTTLGANQICAGGRLGQDSCVGDSGGPLMGIDHFGSQYRIIGIISFGETNCGLADKPAVHIRVGNYLNWIMSNLEV